MTEYRATSRQRLPRRRAAEKPRRASRFLPALLLPLCLLLAACEGGFQVEKIADDPPAPLSPNVVLAPLGFDQLQFRLHRGKRIGVYHAGLDCSPDHGDMWWTSGRKIDTDIEWKDLFHEQMRNAGFNVTGNPGDLFSGMRKDEARAAYIVRGQVEDMRLSLCDVVDVIERKRLGTEYGEASMRLYWQVYSPLQKKVVMEARTGGYARIDQPMEDASTVLMSEAFSRAVANLAAIRPLASLVEAPRPTRESLLRQKTGERLTLPAVPPYTDPFHTHSEAIRYSVVTIDAGEQFGSGVFISPTLVLTNHHVVEGVQTVRLRLVTGREIPGDVLRYDNQRDVALIQVEPAGFQPLPIRRQALAIGQDVYAIGTPLAQKNRSVVTKGVVSRMGSNSYGLPDIMSDADIQSGNSGGPLLDEFGNLAGLAYALYSADGKGSRIGMNLFIPIADALRHLRLTIRHPNDTRSPDEDDDSGL